MTAHEHPIITGPLGWISRERSGVAATGLGPSGRDGSDLPEWKYLDSHLENLPSRVGCNYRHTKSSSSCQTHSVCEAERVLALFAGPRCLHHVHDLGNVLGGEVLGDHTHTANKIEKVFTTPLTSCLAQHLNSFGDVHGTGVNCVGFQDQF
jgi:hypothetical protein